MGAVRKDWKALRVSGTKIFETETNEQCYVLTDQQVQALLPLVEYLEWPTRWYDGSQTKDEIDAFVADLSKRLLEPEECVAVPFDVRVNPTNDCELQKSTDGGETWETWANIEDCLQTSDIILDLDVEITQQTATTIITNIYACPADPGLPPGTPGADLRCTIAHNMATLLMADYRAEVDEIVRQVALGLTAIQVANAITKLLLGIGNPALEAIYDDVLFQADATFNSIYEGLDDSTFYDDLVCAIFCYLANAGMIYADATTQIPEKLSALSALYVVDYFNSWFATINTNNLRTYASQAALGEQFIEADCSGCTCPECGSPSTGMTQYLFSEPEFVQNWNSLDANCQGGVYGHPNEVILNLPDGVCVWKIEFRYYSAASGSQWQMWHYAHMYFDDVYMAEKNLFVSSGCQTPIVWEVPVADAVKVHQIKFKRGEGALGAGGLNWLFRYINIYTATET